MSSKNEAILSGDQISILMDAATVLAGNITSIFSMFLTVVFGALAFSAAISLRDVGPRITVRGLGASVSSLIIAFSLLSFFIISFNSFFNAQMDLYLVLSELKLHTDKWNFLLEDTKSIFGPHLEPLFWNLNLESVGFLIGSMATLISFIWITNLGRDSHSA